MQQGVALVSARAEFRVMLHNDAKLAGRVAKVPSVFIQYVDEEMYLVCDMYPRVIQNFQIEFPDDQKSVLLTVELVVDTEKDTAELNVSNYLRGAVHRAELRFTRLLKED